MSEGSRVGVESIGAQTNRPFLEVTVVIVATVTYADSVHYECRAQVVACLLLFGGTARLSSRHETIGVGLR